MIPTIFNIRTYTCESKITGDRCTLDHFLITDNMLSKISDCKNIYSGDNCSDHYPVSLNLTIETPYVDISTLNECKIRW